MSFIAYRPAHRMQRLTAVPACRAMLALAIACLALVLPVAGGRALAQPAVPTQPSAVPAAPSTPTGTARATSVNGSLLLTDDGEGPAFLVYENFRTLMTWNRSTYFALTAGLLMDSLGDG